MTDLTIPTGDPPPHPRGTQGAIIIDGVLFGEDAACANWVHQVLGGGIVEVGYVGFGIVPEGTPEGREAKTVDLVGGCYFWGFENDAQQDIIASVAVADRLLNDMSAFRPAIRQILDYPFGILKLPRISAEISMSNEKAILAAQRLGFVLEGRKRYKMRNGGDVGMFGLYRDNALKQGFWAPYT